MGEIETALARIWGEVLGLQRIGRRDNFFELGGHSLMAVRVASRVQQRLGIELDLADLFHKPELGALAELLGSATRSELPAIAPVARDRPLALSFAQQRLWFLSQMEGVSQAYHIPMALRLQRCAQSRGPAAHPGPPARPARSAAHPVHCGGRRARTTHRASGHRLRTAAPRPARSRRPRRSEPGTATPHRTGSRRSLQPRDRPAHPWPAHPHGRHRARCCSSRCTTSSPTAGPWKCSPTS